MIYVFKMVIKIIFLLLLKTAAITFPILKFKY